MDGKCRMQMTYTFYWVENGTRSRLVPMGADIIRSIV